MHLNFITFSICDLIKLIPLLKTLSLIRILFSLHLDIPYTLNWLNWIFIKFEVGHTEIYISVLTGTMWKVVIFKNYYNFNFYIWYLVIQIYLVKKKIMAYFWWNNDTHWWENNNGNTAVNNSVFLVAFLILPRRGITRSKAISDFSLSLYITKSFSSLVVLIHIPTSHGESPSLNTASIVTYNLNFFLIS